jgi:hypothetical protein
MLDVAADGLGAECMTAVPRGGFMKHRASFAVVVTALVLLSQPVVAHAVGLG